MLKTDASIRKTCIAAIKRATIKPYNEFKWTKFYELNTDFINAYAHLRVNLSANELIICSTIIDANNYSILTTRKLITNENGQLTIGQLAGATYKLCGNFKAEENIPTTLGKLQLATEHLKYFIETGKAAMIMIYGISNAVDLNNTTDHID